ncbi:MAG: hypothetical protein DRR19_12630 [Candidatus Parabeggiatoa sp. nov. 1]|nr:MAG: hypothetical protein DRR19_12630 [Gammaproteobacteria bacterium]
MGNYLKGSFEVFAIILALTVSYYELKEVIPSDAIIILEVEKLKTPRDTPEYLLTGVVADQEYVLDWVRIIPHSDNPVKRATFKYDHYTTDVNLTEITTTKPHEYLVSTKMLQTEFGDDNFAFAFLDDNRFTFFFQFEGIETEKATFGCKVLAVENQTIPCEVRGKGYLSLFRGIPWYFLAAFFGILIIVLIELIDIFVKRGGRKNVRHGKKTRNRLTPEQD